MRRDHLPWAYSMRDISLPEELTNTGELILVGSLAWLKAIEDVQHGSFQVDVRDRLGGGSLVYQWKTGGSSAFPNSALDYENTSATLTLYAPSADVRAAFAPSVIGRTNGKLVYEIGFFRQYEPDNMVSVGVGAFPIKNGVIL